MAKASKAKSTKKKVTTRVVTREASTTNSKKSTKQTTPTASVAASTPAKRHTKARSAAPLKTGEKKVGYFRGAWQELRQVRWPSRAQTWYLTAAVIIFTGFFVALVLLLDALFKYLFNLMIG